MSTMKAQPAKAPAKAASKPKPVAAKPAAAKPAAPKAPAKAAAKPKAPAKAPVKVAAKAPSKAKAPAQKSSREAMLARVESVRQLQLAEGNFDCFARAENGYCDQGGCVYHVECLSVSRLSFSL